MKHVSAAAVFVLAALSALSAQAQTPALRIQETVTLDIPGATAVYTTNPIIAEATIISTGRLSVRGHSAGTTQLVVVTGGGTQSFVITVAAASVPPVVRTPAGVPRIRYDGRYSSGAARVQNAIDVVTEDESRRSEYHVVHIHDLTRDDTKRAGSIASVFYRHSSADRVLTLLDETVDVSRLTINNTQLRGLHLRQGPLELHAGYASSSMYDSFFLPTEKRWAGGAGYDIQRGAIRWTPSVYGFFSEPAGTAARRGVVAALAAQYSEGDRLYMRGDVGVSSSIAASGEVRYLSSRNRFRALLSIKPDGFPTLGLNGIPGEHLELDWSLRSAGRLSASAYGTYDHFILGSSRQTIGSSRVGFGYALTDRLSFITGAEATLVRTPTASIETVGIPLGLTWESPGYGLAASYRLLDHSETSRRGDTLRLSAHAGRGRFSTHLWAERQRQAPTLNLIFSAQPGLELALLRLGISVRDPEDVARALRDNAALVDLGFITGVNVDLTPQRSQLGLSLGWTGTGAGRDHLRLFATHARDEGIRTTRESTLATLTYSRRVVAGTDIIGSFSWYETTAGAAKETGTSIDLGVRQQFSGIPAFLRRSGTIEGFAFLDPAMRGEIGEDTTPLPDIVVTLDGSRTVRTDAKGAYVFHKVSPGPHRLSAQLPATPRAFFTTPSHVEASVPARVNFGLVWTAARIDGRVVSDAGDGISGVIVSVTAPDGTPITATTDTQGRFVFAVPAGTVRVVIAAMSLPPGYSVTGTHEQDVVVAPDEPQSIAFTVEAIRSIAGRAPGASEVVIPELGRRAPVDEKGNFVFRSMPAGTFALTAVVKARAVSLSVTVPPEPSTARDLFLGDLNDAVAVAAAAAKKEPRSRARSAASGSAAAVAGVFRVAAGAFRDPVNAARTRQRLAREGVTSFTVRSGALTLVYAGPFATREEAANAASRLKRAGFDSYVATR